MKRLLGLAAASMLWLTSGVAHADVVKVGLIADFTGDGRQDLACFEASTGWIAFEFADQAGRFNEMDVGTTPAPQPDVKGPLAEWCKGSQLFVGQFNSANNGRLHGNCGPAIRRHINHCFKNPVAECRYSNQRRAVRTERNVRRVDADSYTPWHI